MRSAYSPYAPLNVLKPVAPNIWIVDGPEISFGYLGAKLPFPTRMTVVRLPHGHVWIHSPTEPTPELVGSIEEIGPVKYLIAPNTIHYWWIPDWKERFPRAEVFGPPGLERSSKRALPPFTLLTDTSPTDWAGAIDQVVVRGDVINEAVFFHRASRTLVLTDLIENFELSRVQKRWLRTLVRWSGAADPDGKAPIDMQLSFLRHRGGVRAAAQQMIRWDPIRVIMAHGRWYEDNGTAECRRAFRWVL